MKTSTSLCTEPTAGAVRAPTRSQVVFGPGFGVDGQGVPKTPSDSPWLQVQYSISIPVSNHLLLHHARLLMSHTKLLMPEAPPSELVYFQGISQVHRHTEKYLEDLDEPSVL